MIRTLTASTEHIDDLDAAVQDIKSQLDEGRNLLKYSVGIIACHYEFALSGAVEAIGKALPFDTVGTITSAHGTAGGCGTLLFTMMVLTSDNVQFTTVMSPSLRAGPGQKLEETFRNAQAGRPEKPALILAYAPFMVENSGDEYVNVLGRASGGVPCFGTLAVDDTSDFRECYMIRNGEYHRDRMALLLIYGPLKPRFFLASISHDKILDRSALITSSQGHILKELNGRPVVEYFEAMGLTRASETSYAMTSLPFMVDYGDGTPVARVFIGLNENKEAICAGAMPEGATLRLGVFDREDVLLTSGRALQEALAAAGAGAPVSGMLIYSCLSRIMTLGADPLAEINLITKEAAGRIPFFMAVSGGEICPTHIEADTAVNRFHNNTFILCLF